MLDDKTCYSLLALIVTGFLVIGGLYALNTPDWQAPDEPAHYNYVAQFAAEGCCPVIAEGDWDADALEALKAERWPSGSDLSAIEYEDHQPPLYYWLAMIVYDGTGGSLEAIRLFSVLLGGGVVVTAFLVGARLFPRYKIAALATAGFVAFIPQHIAIIASVNNDSLAELVLGILMIVAITYVGNPTRINREGQIEPIDISMVPHSAALGGLAGVAYLTKMTLYLPATLIVAAAMLFKWRRYGESFGWFVNQSLWAAGMALLFGVPWWVRNVRVYGWPDLFGLAAHNGVVVGQLRTADYIQSVGGLGPYLWNFLSVSYHSFWGQFGWMGVPMQSRDYALIGAFLLMTLIGFGLLATRFRSLFPLHSAQRIGFWLLSLALLATLVNYLGYNLTFVQFQGRYLYTALIPAGVLITGGWVGWSLQLRVWAGERWQRPLTWIPLAALVWMPGLSLWALDRYIIPYL